MMGRYCVWLLVLSTLAVGGPITMGAHAVTMDEVVAACTECHGLVVNGVEISTDPGSGGFTSTVNGRSEAGWVRTIEKMVRSGAEVANVEELAAFLAGLGIPVATPTATVTATPSPTPTPDAPACTGDCDGSGEVTVSELVTMVNIALGNAVLSSCTAGDADSDGEVTISEIVAAVNYTLSRCPL